MKRKLLWCAVIFLFLGFIAWMVWSNTSLELSHYAVASPEIPASFDGFRIVQISDLHNNELGRDHHRLLARIEEGQPDIIVLTGDLIDSRMTDVETALEFVNAAVKLAPVYYVTGNHEERVPTAYALLEEGLIKAGVHILRNETVFLEREGEKICLAGIDDPHYFASMDAFFDALSPLCDGEEYTVLLSHRPEYFDHYIDAGADLSLAGHIHGGQFRIPFKGGLIAPYQRLFPKYDNGLYEEDGSALVVSRGVGNSIFPIRFNNRRHVVLVELHSTEQ